MREKYESLSLAVLKDLAKARGMKKVSALRKAELIERMLEQDALDGQKSSASSEEIKPAEAEAPKKRRGRPPKAAKETTEASVEAVASIAPESRTTQDDEPVSKAPEESPAGEAAPTKEESPAGETAPAKEERPAREHRAATEGERPLREHRPAHEGERPMRERPMRPERRPEAAGGQKQYRPRPTQEVKEGYRYNRQEDGRARHARFADRIATESGDERIRTVDDRTVQKMEAEGLTLADLDSGEQANGILEVMQEGYGFIRCENYMPGENDVYVSPIQIRRFHLKTGDIIVGNKRVRAQTEKFSALLYITSVNGYTAAQAAQRTAFEELTPIFPNERLRFETSAARTSMRIVDLIAPVGKGQRGMIVSQPKAGKTTLLKEIATSVKTNNPEMHLIILLIDERPEEVTDIKEAIEGKNVEVIYSTFDELPDHHRRVSEMVIERAKRLVEHKKDVMILLDSITRLARAYNLVVAPSGRTLSGGLDPAALHQPKKFFGAARNMREGGSLTILATALVDTGSRMDDVVFEEFKGTGNMELILDRKLSERRIFPAIDIVKSGTRREDLLLNKDEQEAVDIMRKAFNGMKADEAVENVLRMFVKTRSNREFIHQVRTRKFF